MNVAGDKPPLSVILVTKNRARTLERSLAALVREVESDLPAAEVIVIDGGSTDGTIDILRRYENGLFRWISEPDSGVGEAANKGIFHARADIIRFLGDDDELLPGHLRFMVEVMTQLDEYDVIAGHNQLVIEHLDGRQEYHKQLRYRGELSRKDMYRWRTVGILIPEVCFFRKSALERMGGYDLSLKWWGFLDLFFRMSNAGLRFFVLPVVIMKSYQTPESETLSNLQNAQFWKEYFDVINRHAGHRWRLWHQAGGSLRPDRVAYYYATRLCKATGFHPRKMLREVAGQFLGR